MVRKLNTRPDVEYRAEAIAKKLSDYDLVAFNETFDLEPRDLLLASLKSRFGESYYQSLPPPNTESKLGIGSGLAVVSRFPIVESRYLRFGSTGGPFRNLMFADGAAAKGAIYIRIRRAETQATDEVDIYVTHLESRDATIRSQQYRSLAQFIGKNQSASRPVLILGDLNIDGGQKAQENQGSSYHKMLNSFREQLPHHELHDVWIQLGEGPGLTADREDGHGGSRIDYVLIANPKGPGTRLQPRSVRVNDFADERVGTLSDHAAVETEFQWLHTGQR
jgi:endonuclease/exonuclease/phosphatase family metal-dependent hydrolase